jgi:phosphatidylglycerol:prolipoprotein diacylglycerol transferase
LLAYYPFRRRDGEVIALLLTLYPVSRFLLEYIRKDEGGQFGTNLTISQNVSLLMLAGVAVLWYYILRRPRGTAWPPAEAAEPLTSKHGAR